MISVAKIANVLDTHVDNIHDQWLVLWRGLKALVLCAGLSLMLLEPAMAEQPRKLAPSDLGAGKTIDQSITLEAIESLWGCPTNRKNVEPIPGDPGRIVVVYEFPEKRLLADFSDTPAIQPNLADQRGVSAVEFHFNLDGSLIFATEWSPLRAVGGDLVKIHIVKGRGHYLPGSCGD